MSKNDFYETKLTNMANWLQRTVARQFADNEDVVPLVSVVCDRLKEGGLRDNFLNPKYRSVFVEQSAAVRENLSLIRQWFHVPDKERDQIVEDKIAHLERIHANFGNWIERLKQDKELTSADFRAAGAYVEIFFGPILDSMNKSQ